MYLLTVRIIIKVPMYKDTISEILIFCQVPILKGQRLGLVVSY